MSSLTFTIASLFIREAIYLSFAKRAGGFVKLGRLFDFFIPGINDSVLTYNLKWFIGGLGAGLLITIWVPLLSLLSRFVGENLFMLFVISYLSMVILIPLILIIELLNSVVATLKELQLTKKLEYLPISKKDIEKAASYSVLIGGGFAQLIGMGLTTGLIIGSYLNFTHSIIVIPMLFASSMLLAYPIALIAYSKVGGKVPPLISLLAYVSVIVAILLFYFNVLSFGSVDEARRLINNLKPIFPFPYLDIVVNGPSASSIIYASTYTLSGTLLSILIPSKFTLKLSVETKSLGKAFNINYPRIVAMGFKDLLLLARDPSRLKQFYGITVPMFVPFILSLASSSSVAAIRAYEPLSRIFVLGYTGVVSYIVSTLSSPMMIFIEGDRSYILYCLPIRKREVVLSKTFASTILSLPIVLFIAFLIGLLYGVQGGLVVVYSMITYWVTGSLLTLSLQTPSLENQPIAWTQFGINIWKRLAIYILLYIPIGFVSALSFVLYVLNLPLQASLALLAPPSITTVIFMYDLMSED